MFLLVAVAAGLGLSLQTVVNSRLRLALQSPYAASSVSFGVGTLFLGTLLLITRTPFSFTAGVPWWAYLGGACGVVVLTTNIIIFRPLGAIETVLLPLLGQVLGSLAIDNGAWLGAPHHALTPLRIIGAAIMLGGITCAVGIKKLPHTAVPATGIKWPWRILGILSGFFSAAQSAMNGYLGMRMGTALASALVSFATGTLLLLIIVIILHAHTAHRRPTRTLGSAPLHGPWWMWTGGFLGASFVFAIAALVPRVGTGLALMLSMIGQVSGSLLVDRFGILGAQRRSVVPTQIVGVIVMMFGVSLIRMI